MVPQLNTPYMMEEPDNYEQKCLCVLVLDTSGSMNYHDNIQKLNDGLEEFKNAILKDPIAKDRIELAIVTFDSRVDVVLHPTSLEGLVLPRLVASGNTLLVPAIEQAQQIISDRKAFYKLKGLPYYRPWIVVMTDGDPNPPSQDVAGLSSKIKADAEAKKYVVKTIGIGDEVQDDILARLTTPPFKASRMSDVKFSEFFLWLSNSIGTMVTQQQQATSNNEESAWSDFGIFINDLA